MEKQLTCSQCGLCIKECAKQCSAIKAISGGVEINLDRCYACGHCVAVCPTDEMDNPLSARQEKIEKLPDPSDAARFLRSVRSVRYYKDQPVPREQMERLLDIGRYPQTGTNTQGISYLVIEGREKVEALNALFCETVEKMDPPHEWLSAIVRKQRKTGDDLVFRGCPGLILALADGAHPRGRQNAQFSLTFISLLAPTMGIGTCWAGMFELLAVHDESAAPFLEFLKVPQGKRIRGAMMVGLPQHSFKRLVARNPLVADWR